MNYKHNPVLTEKAKELRKNMTNEEKILWYQFLRNYPIRILRQKVIDNYIVDFYCAKAKLIIEFDGSQHYSPDGKIYDKIRTEFFEERNLKIIRIPNIQVTNNFEGICNYIDKIIKESI